MMQVFICLFLNWGWGSILIYTIKLMCEEVTKIDVLNTRNCICSYREEVPTDEALKAAGEFWQFDSQINFVCQNKMCVISLTP